MENISDNFEELIDNLKGSLISNLDKAFKVFIIPHNNMDFDALASSIALSDICQHLGIDNYIVTNDKPKNMKPSFREVYLNLKTKYNFINSEGLDKIKTRDSLFIVTDSCVKNLIPTPNIDSYSDNIIVIDHHKPDNNIINTNNLFISSEACSASEILFYLMKNMDMYITTETAQLLLAGVYLDTKGLFFVNNPSGFRTIAKLLQYGANLQDVQNLFTISNFEDDIKQKELIINLLKFTQFYTDDKSMRFAVTMNNNDPKTVYTNEQLAEACDSLLQYSLDAAFVIGYIDSEKLGEGHSNKISIKARSKISENTVDVAEIMQLFNGGGDTNRAAVSIDCNNIEKISEALKHVIKHNNVVADNNNFIKKNL